VTVIDRFDISIGGRRASIFSPTDCESAPFAVPYDGALYISPSKKADILVRTEGIYSDASGRAEWLSALSFFFSRLRGLPDTELLIEHSGMITELQIFNTGDGLYKHKLPKCKLLCEECVSLDGGIELRVARLLCDGLWHAISLESFPPLGEETLGRIKLCGGISDYQLALDKSGGIHHGDRLPPLLPMLSVSALLLERCLGTSHFKLSYRGEEIIIDDNYCSLKVKTI